MRKHLGLVIGSFTRLVFQPGGNRDVSPAACRPRDLQVGDVTRQAVPEAELQLALHRRGTHAPPQLSFHEISQRPTDGVAISLARRGDSPIPE
jgi:hypothetical protein